MEQVDILSKRIRWLAIATGVASALALFPILFLLYPALLTVGGIIQPRSPVTGRWFVWVGAAMLGPVLMLYDIMILQDAFSSGPYTSTPILMLITFPPATILFIWFCAELAADSIKRIRFWRAMPPTEPRPVNWSEWIIAIVLNALMGWSIGGFLGWYRDRGDHRLDTSGRVGVTTSLVLLAIVLASDVSLVRRVFKLRRARMAHSLK
ncbi:MAG: hypothetical protein WB683_00685 [Candidatus Sulfotelmatobacter sp.]